MHIITSTAQAEARIAAAIKESFSELLSPKEKALADAEAEVEREEQHLEVAREDALQQENLINSTKQRIAKIQDASISYPVRKEQISLEIQRIDERRQETHREITILKTRQSKIQEELDHLEVPADDKLFDRKLNEYNSRKGQLESTLTELIKHKESLEGELSTEHPDEEIKRRILKLTDQIDDTSLTIQQLPIPIDNSDYQDRLNAYATNKERLERLLQDIQKEFTPHENVVRDLDRERESQLQSLKELTGEPERNRINLEDAQHTLAQAQEALRIATSQANETSALQGASQKRKLAAAALNDAMRQVEEVINARVGLFRKNPVVIDQNWESAHQLTSKRSEALDHWNKTWKRVKTEKESKWAAIPQPIDPKINELNLALNDSQERQRSLQARADRAKKEIDQLSRVPGWIWAVAIAALTLIGTSLFNVIALINDGDSEYIRDGAAIFFATVLGSTLAGIIIWAAVLNPRSKMKLDTDRELRDILRVMSAVNHQTSDLDTELKELRTVRHRNAITSLREAGEDLPSSPTFSPLDNSAQLSLATKRREEDNLTAATHGKELEAFDLKPLRAQPPGSLNPIEEEVWRRWQVAMNEVGLCCFFENG